MSSKQSHHLMYGSLTSIQPMTSKLQTPLTFCQLSLNPTWAEPSEACCKWKIKGILAFIIKFAFTDFTLKASEVLIVSIACKILRSNLPSQSWSQSRMFKQFPARGITLVRLIHWLWLNTWSQCIHRSVHLSHTFTLFRKKDIFPTLTFCQFRSFRVGEGG